MTGTARMHAETLEPEAMDPKLLTEVECREAVLAELPEDYEFPLFDGRQAVESQRKSGYKNTPREVFKSLLPLATYLEHRAGIHSNRTPRAPCRKEAMAMTQQLLENPTEERLDE